MVDDAAGLIAGRFRLGGLLGTGGTASVFRARDEVTGQIVAVKLLHPHLSQSDTVREAFLREGRRTAHVSHPSIVAVLDLGTFRDHGIPIAWIAQQIVEGVTLAEHVRASGPLSPTHAAAVASDILDALGAAHAVGLVHRDVSPANVLVRFNDDGWPRSTLLDFGLADAAGETARGDDVLRSAAPGVDAGVVANAHFASPEQLRGQPIDHRGDVYQVGGLLFFALTGRRPFEGANRAAVVQAHLQAPPPVPSVHARGIPPELDRVVVRAMLKVPDDRYADAIDMRRELVQATHRRKPAEGATRVLAPQEPSTAFPALGPVDAQAPSRSIGGREVSGWGLAAGILAVLLAAAATIPMMASAVRPVPEPAGSVVAAPPPTTPSSTAAPAPSATPSPSAVVVPPLDTLDEVRAGLARAGLLIDAVSEREGPQAAGTVIEMQPAPGSVVARGSMVRVVVASGTNRVPAIGGLDATAATDAVRAAGFVAVSAVVASDQPAGSVVGLDPGVDAPLVLGSTVRLLLAAGPEPASPTPTPTATPTPTPRATSTATPTTPSPTPTR